MAYKLSGHTRFAKVWETAIYLTCSLSCASVVKEQSAKGVQTQPLFASMIFVQ